MIDQERVREMTKLAAYEARDGKKYKMMTRFFRSDFVGRHLLKAFVAGTAAYGILLLMWGLCHFDALLKQLDTIDFVQFGIAVLVRYLVFQLVYLVAVDIYANLFYAEGKRNIRRFYRHLKRLDRLYEEEESRRTPNQIEDD